MRCLFFLLIALVCSTLTSSAAAQFTGGAAPFNGLLLLKNGETLAGDITRSGDYFIVAEPDSELQIRQTDVEAVCRDLDEAYRRKASTINSRSADDRTALAQWCIEHRLFGNAARELTEAYRIDDTHPRLALLERRLRAEMAEPKPTPEAPATPRPPTINDEELERTARSISPELLHEFTVRVQPLLVNYCATAGCHGPKPSSEFHLHRVYLNERNDPRLARMNLQAVLARIDKQYPGKSPLLSVPLGAHGGETKPVFDGHNAEHYRLLAGWAMRAAGAGSANSTTAATASTPVPTPTGALMQRLPIDPPTSSVAPTTPPKAPPSAPAPTNEPQRPEPVDPFDPAQFNQRRD